MSNSACDGLSLSTVQSLVSYQNAIHHGVVLLSPWTDLPLSAQRYIRNR